ncbi:hypothetical protein [Brevundimonas intermedia]|nr:hypothetical protein [Brevundimonas intermedia]
MLFGAGLIMTMKLLDKNTMKKDSLRLLAVSIIGTGFWAAASVTLAAVEPWDSPYYLAWFLASLVIGATFSWFFPTRSWRWGPIMVFGQAPVMLVQTGLEPLFVVALGWLALEAIPAILISAAAGKAKTLWLGRSVEAHD